MCDNEEEMLAKAKLFFVLNPEEWEKWKIKRFRYCQRCMEGSSRFKGFPRFPRDAYYQVECINRLRVNLDLNEAKHGKFSEERDGTFWPCLHWINYV